jgi:hypothetical protein
MKAARRVPEPALNVRVTIRSWYFQERGGDSRPDPRRLGCYPDRAWHEIARQTGLPILAHSDPAWQDYYSRSSHVPSPVEMENVSLTEALDRLCRLWNMNWEFRRGWILVRSPRFPFALEGEVDLSPRNPRHVIE